MTDDVLGRGHDGDVGAMRKGIVEERRRPGVVQYDGDVVGVGAFGDGRDVLDFKGLRPRALREDGLGGGPEQLFNSRADRGVIVGRGDAEAGQGLVTEGSRRAVDRVGDQQVVATGHGAQNGQGAGLQARGAEHRAGAAFQLADGVLQGLDGGGDPAAVGVGLALVLEGVQGPMQDGGGVVDGRVHGPVMVKGRAPGVDYPCRSLALAASGFGHLAGVSFM